MAANTSDSDSKRQPKIDPVTSLQETIDGLSLSMFEALRSLRDAVAPESGNLGGTQQKDTDLDDLWLAYKNGDTSMFSNGGDATSTGDAAAQPTPQLTKREDFIKAHAKEQMQKDTSLVVKLSQVVLERSQEIDSLVDNTIPGMNRTKDEQMKIIEQLVRENEQATRELQETYEKASEQRDACRSHVQKHAGAALGIQDEDEDDLN